MAGRSIARMGAATVVLGLSLMGPHAGVAAADRPDTDAGSPAAGSPAGKQPTPRSQRGTRGARAASSAHGTFADRPVRAGVPAASASRRPDAPRAVTADSPGEARQSGLPAAAVAQTPRREAAPASRPPTPEAPRAAGFAAAEDMVHGPVEVRSAAASSSPPDSGATVVPSTVPAERAVAPIRPSAVASAANGSCPVCLGGAAPSIGQALSTVVNHLFNSTFDALSTLPGGPFSDLVTGALALVRRTLFFIPEGVTASQTGNSLSISVNTGSVAYFRQDGSSVQVSGDPLFWGAKTFAMTADQTVAVSNPGNAGCAGFVFTSGTAAGGLQTSQIDAIRFEGTSAFGGRVHATMLGGPLTLRDAVRGMDGVIMDAVIVLANDVEIDGGKGNAIFDGTVDGTKNGKQALSVTALGTTAFVAPVGAIVPLKSLLTQGISPLTVEQTKDSKTIPLHFLPEMSVSPPRDASGGVKYGIDVAIGDNPSQVYEFDTGGTGLFAGYNQPFWVNVPLTTTPASEVYNSGNYYDGVVSNTVVTLGRGQQTVSTAQPIAIGAVLAGGNSKNGKTFDFTNPSAPPVEGRFFGDFGASFAVKDGLTSPLVQLPGNLANGFLVQVGPIGVQPQLTVGITDQLRAQFPYAVPVILSPEGGTYPTSGLDVLDQFGFAPTYSVTRNGDTKYLGTEPPLNITCATSDPCLPTLIDSGAPTTGIRLGEKSVPYFATPDGKQLLPGTTFTATFPTTPDRPTPLTWEFIAGNNSSVDEVNYEQTQKVGNPENVNAALTLYNYFDVMFDVKEHTIYLRPTGAQADVYLDSVTTTGNQTYRQNARLGGTYTTDGGSFSVAGVTTLIGDTSIATGGADVTFSGTVDDLAAGASSLTVNSAGTTTFVRAVGSLAPLASLTTDAGGTTTSAGVATSADQSYGDDVSLSGLYSVDDGTFSIGGTTTLMGPTSIVGGDITVNGTIDSQQGKGFQLALTPGNNKTATLNGDIGSGNPLGGLQVSAVALGALSGVATINVPASVGLQGNLGYSSDKGIDIGVGTSAAFTGGGIIQNFSGSGVIIADASPSQIEGFAISGNGKAGIEVTGTGDVQITGNNIVGNGSHGISLTAKSDRASITGNTISVNGADGIHVEDSRNAGINGNTIAGNGTDGVEVKKGNGNSILTNSIFSNSGVGIRLSDNGNDSQPAPKLKSAQLSASNSHLVVSGKVDPVVGVDAFEIQVFYSPSTAASNVQGETWIFTQNNVAAGDFTVTIPVNATITAGGFVTATATALDGPANTSVFSDPSLVEAVSAPE